MKALQKNGKGSADEIRGRECADYIREFCAEQRAAAAEYLAAERTQDENGNSTGKFFTKPS